MFSFSAIKKAWKEAKLKSEREHVGPYIENNSNIFKNGNLKLFHGLEKQRWTMDEPEDYELLKAIFNELYRSDSPFLTYEVLRYIKENPELERLNQKIVRNQGYIQSLREDGEM